MAIKPAPLSKATLPIFDDWLEIQIEGEVDLASLPLFSEWLEEPLATGQNLSLNLQACDFLDCAVLAEILRAQRKMQEMGQMLCISCMSPSAHRLFDLTGLLATDLVREPGKAL